MGIGYFEVGGQLVLGGIGRAGGRRIQYQNPAFILELFPGSLGQSQAAQTCVIASYGADTFTRIRATVVLLRVRGIL